uniref:Uncharacterized protein n=1 Tax=Arundo donax TaxID=35708 RepID=A0A0A9G837_ARUDO
MCWLSLFITAKFTMPMCKGVKKKELLRFPILMTKDQSLLEYLSNQPKLSTPRCTL